MQLDEREVGNQAGGSWSCSANFFPVPFSIYCLGVVLMSWQILACLLQSAQSVCPTANFFLGALAATRAETHQDYGGVVLHVTHAIREFHWQRPSVVHSL